MDAFRSSQPYLLEHVQCCEFPIKFGARDGHAKYFIGGNMYRKWIGVASATLFGLMLALSAQAAVDLNTATASELETVKGIGPAKAKAIVAHREKEGAFKSVDDLSSVKGFGKASVSKLKGELTVTGAVAPATKATEKK